MPLVREVSVLADASLRVRATSTLEEHARRVVGDVTDASTLKTIATTSPIREACLAAVARLTDHRDLRAVAECRSADRWVRREALSRLRDDSLAKRIAEDPNEEELSRRLALELIADEPWLVEFAVQTDGPLAEAAFARVRDARLLLGAARRVATPARRRAVLSRVNNRTLLAEFVTNEFDSLDADVVSDVFDQLFQLKAWKTLAGLARHPRTELRLAAVGGVQDQALLALLASSDPDLAVRKEAIRKLDDVPVLRRLQWDASETIACHAAWQLDQDHIKAREATDLGAPLAARLDAIARLKDEGILDTLMSKNQPPEIRAAAAERATLVRQLHELDRRLDDMYRWDKYVAEERHLEDFANVPDQAAWAIGPGSVHEKVELLKGERAELVRALLRPVARLDEYRPA